MKLGLWLVAVLLLGANPAAGSEDSGFRIDTWPEGTPDPVFFEARPGVRAAGVVDIVNLRPYPRTFFLEVAGTSWSHGILPDAQGRAAASGTAAFTIWIEVPADAVQGAYSITVSVRAENSSDALSRDLPFRVLQSVPAKPAPFQIDAATHLVKVAPNATLPELSDRLKANIRNGSAFLVTFNVRNEGGARNLTFYIHERDGQVVMNNGNHFRIPVSAFYEGPLRVPTFFSEGTPPGHYDLRFDIMDELDPAVHYTIDVYTPLGVEPRPQVTVVGSWMAQHWQSIGLAAVVLAAAGLAWRRRRGTFAFFVAAYFRNEPSRTLEHPRREQLYDAIAREPGIRYRELLRTSALANGALAFHLDVLEKRGFIRAEREANATRYWAIGQR